MANSADPDQTAPFLLSFDCKLNRRCEDIIKRWRQQVEKTACEHL